ncbi:hypothetical protein V490_02798 [Pseudogymnoascus sp. VKM F-3557]|nr:hypothetical protein V490_02798 [Pseudogymnoascus sp. VKM F-3557]
MVREIVSQKIRGRLLFSCLFGGFLCAEKGQEKKKPALGKGTHVVLLGGIHTNAAVQHKVLPTMAATLNCGVLC